MKKELKMLSNVTWWLVVLGLLWHLVGCSTPP